MTLVLGFVLIIGATGLIGLGIGHLVGNEVVCCIIGAVVGLVLAIVALRIFINVMKGSSGG